MNIRILVADDFEPWRRFVSSLIAPRKPEWSIVCEVSDGVEAVEKAGDLRPELILLDIGLPKLNGIGVRDLEGAIMAGGTPNSRRIRGCDGSNGRR